MTNNNIKRDRKEAQKGRIKNFKEENLKQALTFSTKNAMNLVSSQKMTTFAMSLQFNYGKAYRNFIKLD